MKYFANILNPFAPILTKKLAEITGFNLTFDMIAPSHGAIWRENPLQIVEKYAACPICGVSKDMFEKVK